MKFEIGENLPEYFQPDWPEQYDIFSHFEFACGIPQAIFAVTTLKQNGQPNVCLQSWSSFFGGSEGYFVVLGGLMKHTHTYSNILREKQFCVNFLPLSYYDDLKRSIEKNHTDADEIAVCGLTAEPGKRISAPRIAESFLAMECTLHQEVDLSGSGVFSLLVGRVLQAAVAEEYAYGMDAKYADHGFFFNIHSPVNIETGVCDPVGFATLQMNRTESTH
ncbi:MAG: flavin reductase family protein [Eubacteriales bacterium]|nr:flavin reductase family protein [Eubacteriales bacterium]